MQMLFQVNAVSSKAARRKFVWRQRTNRDTLHTWRPTSARTLHETHDRMAPALRTYRASQSVDNKWNTEEHGLHRWVAYLVLR